MTHNDTIAIESLAAEDAAELAALIAKDTPDYREHFTPFSFESDDLRQRIDAAKRDRYWGIRIDGELAAFFMLRGFDEGYDRPSFGVYVGECFSGLGLASLALQYALSWCKMHKIGAVMLKVHPENKAAHRVYERAGFAFDAVDTKTGHHVLTRTLTQPS